MYTKYHEFTIYKLGTTDLELSKLILTTKIKLTNSSHFNPTQPSVRQRP